MRCLVIYQSVHHGNTEKIAKEIAKCLDADLKRVNEINKKDLTEYDLIGFGSGIYFLKHHKSLLEFVEDLPQMNKKAFIFSTRGLGCYKFYHRALRKKLIEKGFKIVGEFSCKGYDTYGILKLIGGINKGRPNEQDLEKARKFAMRMKKVG